jgi:Ca-activated chloride channel family protein
MSDGEVTNDREGASYGDFAQFIDSGAVLGYGSEAGGRMRENHSYIYDYDTGKDAISRIDEENLKAIAQDMGVMYLNMNSGNSALPEMIELIKQQSTTIVEKGEGAEKYVDIYYYFAAVLAVMLLVETVIFIRKGRM